MTCSALLLFTPVYGAISAGTLLRQTSNERQNRQTTFYPNPSRVKVYTLAQILKFSFQFLSNSTELMRRIKRYQIANYDCLLVKYEKDDRYDKDGVATHDRLVSRFTG